MRFVIPAKAGTSETKGRPAGDTVFHWMPGQARHDEMVIEVLSWSGRDVRELMARAAALRDEGHGRVVSYSPKVLSP